MKIRFLVDDWSPSPAAYSNVADLLKYACDTIVCPSEAIGEVIVASRGLFGDALVELTGDAFHSDGSDFVACGKTVDLTSSYGRRVSGIVFWDRVIGAAIGARCKLETQRTGEEQRWIYLVLHEVAHALNNQEIESSASSCLLKTDGGLFKAEYVVDLYSRIIVHEIWATYYSAMACNQMMFDLENSDAIDSACQLLDELEEEMFMANGDESRRERVLYLSTHAFGKIFMQYAKLGSYLCGNSAISGNVRMWSEFGDGASIFVERLMLVVHASVDGYPVVSEDVLRAFYDLWMYFVDCCGYRVVLNGEHESDQIQWAK
jgi:hypothetical protein